MKNNQIKSFKDLMNDTSKPPTPIIGSGVLLQSTMLFIVGPPKSRKTFLGYNFATAMARGKGFAGFEINKKHKVLIVSGEGGYFPNRDRIKVIAKYTDDESLEMAHIVTAVDINVDDNSGFLKLGKIIEKVKPDVLIIDPLIRFHNQDENTSTGMSLVMSKFRNYMEKYNLSMIVIHHTGKNASKGARGSNVISGEYDSGIYITKCNNNHTLRFDMRHVESPANRALMFNSATLWFEDSNDHTKDDPVLSYIRGNGPALKSEIVKYLVSNNICSNSHAYRKVDKVESNGDIVVQDDGKTLELKK